MFHILPPKGLNASCMLRIYDIYRFQVKSLSLLATSVRASFPHIDGAEGGGGGVKQSVLARGVSFHPASGWRPAGPQVLEYLPRPSQEYCRI